MTLTRRVDNEAALSAYLDLQCDCAVMAIDDNDDIFRDNQQRFHDPSYT